MINLIKKTALLTSAFSFSCVALAAAPSTPPPPPPSQQQTESDPSEQPIRVVGDEMDCDQRTNICRAVGNAFAQKLNDPKQQSISAHMLVAHFEKKEKDESSKKEPKNESSKDQTEKTTLKKIEAFGNVILSDTQTVIRCDEGVYYPDTETADLEGNVSLTQGKNQLTGTHGHANLRDGTYNIVNEKGRVEGIFYKKEKNSSPQE